MLRKSLSLSILVGILVLTVSILSVASNTNTGTLSVAKGTNALPVTGKVDPASDIVFDLSPGTGVPPATLGGHTMTPVPYPGAPACTGIYPGTPIPTPVAGSTITVSPWTYQACIGSGWATWSHGYAGDVYFSDYATSQTITLPAGTKAFYFYVEPNSFAEYTFKVVADGVSSGPFIAHGSSGAKYVGVYNTAGMISSITIMCDDPYGFASGEYGWSGGAVVETGTIVGKVTDYYENPIPQAFVLVIKLPPKLGGCIFTKTDDYGAYKIPDLAAPAPYLVLCFKKGFQFAWARAIVEPGGTTILDFTLSPKIVE